MIAGRAAPRVLIEEPTLLRLAVEGIEVVDVDGEMVGPGRLYVVTLEEVELLVAEREPEHRLLELRRGQPAHAEQLLVKPRRLLHVLGVNGHVIDPQRSH